MISVLKSDFYKLLRRKSFYICGLLAGVIGIISVVLIKTLLPGFEDYYDFNGINSMSAGIRQETLLITVFLSLFVSSEFSSGTIKNIASRGKNRITLYLSKIFMGIFTTVVYTLFVALCGFIAGSISWGVGEYNQSEFLDILRLFALFTLAEVCLQSVFIAIAFIIRHTGGTIALNIGILYVIAELLFPLIDYIFESWSVLGYTIKSSDYWVGSYINLFTGTTLEQDVINRGIIVCLCYFVASTVIGIVQFCKRDIN